MKTQLHQRNYRGTRFFTAKWEAHDGVEHSKEFDDEQEAQSFLDSLTAQEPASAVEDQDILLHSLRRLESTPFEFAALVDDIANEGYQSLSDYVSARDTLCNQCQRWEALGSKLGLSADMLYQKVFEILTAGISVQQIDQLVRNEARVKQQTEQALKGYIQNFLNQNQDLDEADLAEKRLRRFLESFDASISDCSEDDVDAWMKQQPGSSASKMRYQETIDDFMSYFRRKYT